MKIAFLSHLDLNLYLFRLPIMKALVEEGHTVYAICPRGDKFELFEKDGIIAVEYKIERASLNIFKELKAIYNIYRAVHLLKLDMIHTFTAKPNIYGTIAAKIAKVPTIINLVEGLGSFYIQDSVKNIVIRTVIEKLYKLVFLLSDKVVFVNTDDPQYLESKNVIKNKKIKIIKSVGIDTSVFDPEKIQVEEIELLEKSLDLSNKIIVLMVARAIWHKGVREFYEASTYFSNLENVQFILVGDIDEGNHSSANREYLQSGNVLWLGHRDDIFELTAMSDIYVLPSYREGVPRTLLEAASMGKPIVTTNTVGCREVVKNGKNGFLVPIQNTELLVEKIEYLLKHSDERKVMGENGRILAINEFDVKRIVEQYLELYIELKK
ncbi:MAG: Alpha-1,3-N-acetylgalactosamine transferase PglA (EC [uncultured Sulfurovum sp.]|uniref:Alpha-1,3-N-acetylgalactosamine transferase PglA (EC) n=1 Tax=uncultured Sulfurovum sp. TaxID=269237 RepID=A0A6S6TVB5_9BACT|nr:MAG: Alpha-1,3-N-acetylgalactosamine transferase PglA (EC [uncultured Sulfurovum sp.]